MSTSPLTPKQQYWLNHFIDFEHFDGSLKHYAQSHNLKITDLYSWRKLLRDKGLIKPLIEAQGQSTSPLFSRIHLPTQGGMESVQICTSQLTMTSNILPDPQWLAILNRALEHQS